MAKKMRTINNPLDRQTRNDINYNFGVLDNALEDMANSEAADNERFTRIENDVTKLKKEDKNLSDRIDANKELIEAMDLDAIKLQGDTAEKQGIEAKKKGDKAESQGKVAEQKGNIAEGQGVVAETKGIKAEQQGNYAKEMGDYAKEKAEYASAKTSEIEQAHTDLSQIKVEAVDATQNANTQANYAKEQGDYAKSVGDEVSDKLIDIENAKDTLVSDASDAIETVIEKGNITEQQGLKAEEQATYAKEQGDYAKGQAEYAAEKTAEIEQAHTDLSEIKKDAIEATDEASKQANRAKEEADRAKPLVDVMEKELPNIENLKHVGSWSESTEYKKNQEVLFNGSTYRALEDNKGTQPTDKSVWQLIAQRGVDGEGAVGSVNGIMPDSDGNVDLGDIADKQYVDEKIGDVDLSALETKEDATAKLEEAKSYTDEEIAKIPSGIYSFPRETELDPNAPMPTSSSEGLDIPHGWSIVDRLNLTSENRSQWQKYLMEGLPGSGGFFDYILIYNNWDYVRWDGQTVMTFVSSNHRENAIRVWDKNLKRWSLKFEKQVRDVYQSNNSNTNPSTTVFGRDNKARGTNSLVWGTGNEVLSSSEWGNLVLGDKHYVEGIQKSAIIGHYFQGKDAGYDRHRYEYLIGYKLSSNDEYYTVTLGTLNQDIKQQSLIVGNGALDRGSNALTLSRKGELTIQGEYKTGGADYAEMFEWEDKNPENADRVALAVTWGEGESIKLANSGDEIIGIVSATAAILGDDPMDWDKRFVTDQFGRPLRKEYNKINEDGEEETYEWFVENPEYDKDAPYIPRSERPEWDAIGLMGKLYWIDDGTLEVGDYATVGVDGVATKGDKSNGYRVMKRISKNVDGSSGVVKVFFK